MSEKPLGGITNKYMPFAEPCHVILSVIKVGRSTILRPLMIKCEILCSLKSLKNLEDLYMEKSYWIAKFVLSSKLLP